MNESADRTAVGKIGRMPADVRREVSRRLADNETAGSVIAYLESVPAAIQTLNEYFDGARVLPQNLSEWKRNPEYQRFCRQREDVARARAYSEYAVDMAKASGGISAGSVAVLGGKILEMLESAEPSVAADLIDQVTRLRAREQKDAELDLKKRAQKQKDRALNLAEAQFEVRTCEIFLKWYDDKRVAEIKIGRAHV